MCLLTCLVSARTQNRIYLLELNTGTTDSWVCIQSRLTADTCATTDLGEINNYPLQSQIQVTWVV